MWFVRFSCLDDAVPRELQVPVYRAEDGGECCVYLDSADSVARVPGVIDAVRLEPLQALGAALPRGGAPWHYVVATDVEPAAEADFNTWYEQEHLPGLAAVPGTLRAARFRVVEGAGPRYHAGYDLAERSAFNGPAWLAVRGTAWSSRVRPHFVNTRRTMYRRVP
ncbi:MAG: hypothetical protein JSR75_06600 [Proteobacteria bacterium]|nr:hypothetical protein [Pseudomonadota bacterium]